MAHDLTIDQLRYTKNQFVASNPTPLNGQLCVETDTGTCKEGNGTTAYLGLPPVQLSGEQRRSADDVWAARNEPAEPVTSAPVTPFLYLTAGQSGSTAIYEQVGTANGKPWYRQVGAPGEATLADPDYAVIWDDPGSGLQWNVTDADAGVIYASTSAVATPDLATGWTAESGTSAPTPSIFLVAGPTVQEALEQVAARRLTKVAILKVTQNDTEPPVVYQVLANDFGVSATPSYDSVGQYSLTFTGASFTDSNATVSINKSGIPRPVGAAILTGGVVAIYTQDTSFSYSDSIIDEGATITITQYQ